MNNNSILINLLTEEMALLDKAEYWLNRSNELAKPIDFATELTENELDILDNLATRFMRYYEVLINQVLRTLLELLGEAQKTKIDTFNKAESLDLCDSAEILNTCRITRNKIVHEYSIEDWISIYKDVFLGIDELRIISGRVKKEIEKRQFI